MEFLPMPGLILELGVRGNDNASFGIFSSYRTSISCFDSPPPIV